jgi:predicted exporter
MESFAHIASIGQAIQLAVAPVFLLTGVGATLNVFASRIGRIIDRARIMEDQLQHASTNSSTELLARLGVLSKRAKLVNRAIGLSVLSGILVSFVVAALFVSAVLKIDLSLPIAIAFVLALLGLASAFLYFLREVFIATESLRFGGARKP